jgi:hypothetical protein
MVEKKFKTILVLMIISLQLFNVSCAPKQGESAAAQTTDKTESEVAKGFAAMFKNTYQSKKYNKIEERKELNKLIEEARKKTKDETASAEARAEAEIELNLYKQWALDESMYGNAIASGLAGKDYLKVIEDQHITSLSQGFLIGMATRTAGVFGDVLSKRIEGAIDRIVGGVWDAIFVDGWNNMRDLLLHDGNKPFVNRQLKGWRDLVFSSFNDIERLLKDGIRDSLRGRDMTLRENDADATPEEKVTLSAWIILIGGYIRQFDYIIFNIEKCLPYYQEDDFVVFYAKELQTRLLETEQILAQCKSIRELDNLIDSNKALISALNKNVINLFSRLMELVDAQQSSSLQLGTSAIMGRGESSRRGDSMGGNGGMDEDYSYHTMSGRAF